MGFKNIQLVRVTYGGHQITNGSVQNQIREKMVNGEYFTVTNDNLGGDPKPGEKQCTFDWRYHANGPLIRCTVKEYDSFDFATYVSSIKYGGVELMDKPEVYERLNKALYDRAAAVAENFSDFTMMFNQDKCRITLDNGNLGGDPRPGVEKECNIEIQDRSDVGSYWHKFDEGDLFPHKEFKRVPHMNVKWSP